MNITIQDKQGRMTVDLHSYDYTNNRRIFLFETVTDETAQRCIEELSYLEMLSPDDDICMYINSPGGSVTAGLAILDAMKRCSCDIRTYATGLCASMAAVLLACGGKPGKRMASMNSEIMIHQPLGGVSGSSSDMELAVKRIFNIKQKLHRLLSDSTGQSLERIAHDTDRDHYMTASEAQRYGLIDIIQ